MSSSFSLNCPILNSTNLQLLPSNRRFTEYRCFESDPSLAVAISPLSAMYLSVFLGLYPALVSAWFSVDGKIYATFPDSLIVPRHVPMAFSPKYALLEITQSVMNCTAFSFTSPDAAAICS